MTRSLQGFLEELLGRRRVAFSGKPKVDRGTAGIDGTIQVPPASTLANVRFVDSQEPLVGFNSRRLSCSVPARSAAPSAKWLCGQQETSFHEQFLNVPIRKREPQ